MSQQLHLLSASCAILTRTTTTINPNDASDKIVTSYPCDLAGNKVDPGLICYRDLYSGKTYARIAEVIPSGTASADKDAAAAIQALKPIHFCSEDGTIKGYFVEAPDYNDREPKAAA